MVCLQAKIDYLSGLLIELPEILDSLPVGSLKAMLSTSRSLRSLIHTFASRMAIATQKDASLLLCRTWPNLRHLQICGTLQCTHMQKLCKDSWSNLTSLNLSRAKLSLPCLQLLAQGSWQSLTHLNLSQNKLYGPHMKALHSGTWPTLKVLVLTECSLNRYSMSYLASGPWHQLEVLGLGYNRLTDAEIAKLSKAKWPQLKELNLTAGFSWLKAPAALQHISMADWPKVVQVSLCCNILNAANLSWLVQCP